MRPIRFTITGTGTQIVPLDWRASPTNIRISVSISATATYSVDATMDDPYNPAVAPTWNGGGITAPIASGSAAASTTITAPFTALRANVTASTGSVTFEIIQSGDSGGA